MLMAKNIDPKLKKIEDYLKISDITQLLVH